MAILQHQPLQRRTLSGATTPTLTITGASASDVGHYRVLVSNGSGSVYSQSAALALLGLTINPVVTIQGKIGDTYRVDYSTMSPRPPGFR